MKEFTKEEVVESAKEKGNKKYLRTKRGMITQIYNSQVKSSKDRGYDLPTYTSKELYDWFFLQDNFNKVYEGWVNSGYHTDFKPSIDRINDYVSYTIENIQLMTWKENRDKAHSDSRNGINNKKSRAIIQININGDEINHHSVRSAARVTGINRGNITRCLKGGLNHAGGYNWKHKK